MQNIPPQPKVQLSARIPGLLSGADNQVEVLIQIQAPDELDPLRSRAPLNLAIVLDRSGSMHGEPLHHAKRCAKYFVSQMQADDQVAIVAYDNRARTLLSCQAVGDRSKAMTAIDQIHAGGSTDLHQGWMTGVSELEPHTQPNTISRVLLLSDGRANQGISDTNQIAEHCQKAAANAISTSTYGLGWNFNEDLMTSMAQHGEGQSYFGETAEDLLEPFQQEFDLLSSLYARKVRLAIECEPGITAEVLNTYMGNREKNLPDLAHGAEIWALVRFSIPSQFSGSGVGESIRVGEFRVTGVDLEGHAIQIGTAECVLPSLSVFMYESLSENELVARRLGEVMAARLQDDARRAAQMGHWDEVQRLLAKARELAGTNPWVEAIINQLERLANNMDEIRFSKEARYSSLKLSTRYAAFNEGIDDQAQDAKASSFTRRKRQQGKGSA